MQTKRLTDTLSVTGQIDPDDIARLAAQGFRSVINNRPDGEGDDQPRSEALASAAQQAGLDYRHIPIVPGQLQDSQVGAFTDALEQMPGPTLAFCRTGTRSTMLWALGAVHDGNRTVDDVLETAAQAGYDLAGLKPRLAQAAASPKSGEKGSA
ncbi:MAG: TIGR01244 family phosphatase [Rhodanobacter sp.]|nr:MAG: TIGR01244 family phosphatase [Rhodanobacter sp.]